MLSAEQLGDFFAELYSLRRAGVVEQEALEIIATDLQPKKAQFFYKTLLECGDLAHGLAKFPDFIPQYLLEVLQKARQNNHEVEVLAVLADHLALLSLNDQNGVSYRKKLINSLIYPLSILFIGFILASFILMFIMPTFEEMFLSFDTQLPALTDWFIAFIHYIEPIINIVLILLVGAFFYLSSGYGEVLKDKLLLKLPFFGQVIRTIETAAFIKNLSLLVHYQFSLPEAVSLSAQAAENSLVKTALQEAAEEVTQGGSLAESLADKQLGSAHTLRLLAVFEKTQELFLLERLSQSYYKQIQHQLNWAVKITHLLLLALSWLLIGFTVVALYLPLFAVGAAI